MLGIDVGGSGVKGAPVDLATGALAVPERYRVATPQPATPTAVAGAVTEVVEHFDWKGPFGCAFPAIVRDGIVLSAANIDDSWIGVDGEALFSDATGQPVTMLNDADAAGLAEISVGAGWGVKGVVILLTFGTGIGSGMFVDGVLVPNTELGHLEFRGEPAEDLAAARLVEDEDMPLDEWTERVAAYLRHVERLFSPNLFIFGGGISKRFDEFANAITGAVPIVPAMLRNNAGIVGAAMAAQQRFGGIE